MLGVLYLVALYKHAERDARRDAPVELTAACAAKLEQHGLAPGEVYQSPHLLKTAGSASRVRGYSEADIRVIQRGCNIVDDMQGEMASDGSAARWEASRFSRSTHATCRHCHRDLGDRLDSEGKRPIGSNGLGASWVMADMYDRFTGLILPFELRQMQCYINSSNGFKPNAADDLIRDVTAYTRFLSAAHELKIGNRYPEQGMAEIPASATERRGDDYVRGAHVYRERCASCHGPQAFGTVAQGRTLYPALAGPNSFTLDSRMYWGRIDSVMPGFICHNMPPGQEGTLEGQDCRDIAYYLGTLPRPAGDRQGPLVAAWQQLMMGIMPPLTKYAETLGSINTPHAQ
jgi:thiosulfate dehydrogenase